MKILYVTQFYPPESIAGAFRAKEHAARWACAGNEVTVLTGWPNYPTGRLFDGYTPQLLGEFEDGNVRVLRSKLAVRPNTSFLKRIVNGGSFFFFGCLNALVQREKIGKDYDIVLASSGTVFAAYIGLFHAILHHIPFVVEFRDLTFDQMVATGSKRNSWKVRLMRSLELRLARKADSVIVLTEGFRKRLIECGIRPASVSVIPNGASVHSLKKTSSEAEITFGYFGTMGISQNVPETLEISELIGAITGSAVKYTLIGEGAARREIEDLVEAEYPSVNLLHGLPQEELERFYANCDFTFVSLKRSDSFGATVPSKIFQSFARGVPVIFLGPDGEAAKIIRDHEAGLVLCGDERDNEKKLASFFNQEDWRQRAKVMGRNAHDLIRKEYSRTVLADRVLAILDNASRSERLKDK